MTTNTDSWILVISNDRDSRINAGNECFIDILRNGARKLARDMVYSQVPGVSLSPYGNGFSY